jgi:anti-sigma factor RsiW
MTTPISDRDWEAISAYLDEELNPKERAGLDARLSASPELRAALEDMRRTRALLRSQPRLRAPRNFTLSAQVYGGVPQRRPTPRLSPVFAFTSALASILFVAVIAGEFLTAGSRLAAMPMAAEVAQETAPMQMEAPAEAASQADQAAPSALEVQSAPTEAILLAPEGEELSSKAVQPEPEQVGAAETYPQPSLSAPSAAMVYPSPEDQVPGAVEAPLPEATPALEEAPAARSTAGVGASPTPAESIAQAVEPQLALQETPLEAGSEGAQPPAASGGFFSGWRLAQLVLILLALASGTVAFFLRRSGS